MEKYTLDAPRLKSLISNLHPKVMSPPIFESSEPKMYVIDFNTFLLSQSDNKTVEVHRYADAETLKSAFQFIKLNRRRNNTAAKYQASIMPAYREFLFEMALINLKLAAHANTEMCVKCYVNLGDLGKDYPQLTELEVLQMSDAIISDSDTFLKYILDNFGKELTNMSVNLMNILENSEKFEETLRTAIGYMEVLKRCNNNVVEVMNVTRIEE